MRFPTLSLHALAALAVIASGLCFEAPAHALNIETVTSPGGITAWLVEDHTLPVVTINLAFRGGGALDPADKEGLATLTTDLLDEGAGDLDSTAYQGREEDLATSISFSAGADDISASMRTLTANLGPACDLLRLALVAPRFDDAAVTRVRSQLIAEVAGAERQPRYIASRDWWANAFPDHPYGRPLQGTSTTLARITADDMRQFVHTRFAKDALIIGVVGDIAPDALKTLLDQTFGALPAQVEEGSVGPATVTNSGSLILAGLPIPQSVVTFGEAGIKRDDPDWYAALLVDYVLGGGGFDSRLTLEVREKRGLAYSVYSLLDPRQHGGVILGGVATENAHVAESIGVIRAEWQRMHDDGPTAKELAEAKTYITGSFPLTLDSTERIASTLVVVQRDRLGIDYLDRRTALIDAVTLADAKRVAQRLFDPAALSFVVVGAPEHLEGARQVPVTLSEVPPGILTPPPDTIPPPLPTGSVGQGLR
jgi:zinc protease